MVLSSWPRLFGSSTDSAAADLWTKPTDLYSEFSCRLLASRPIVAIYYYYSARNYFPVLLCLSVSVKSLAVKTASEMTYVVSDGALISTHSLTQPETDLPSSPQRVEG